VEVTEQHAIPRWQYRQADDGDARGVLINLSPTGCQLDTFFVLEGLEL
jgi:hypothetical protein